MRGRRKKHAISSDLWLPTLAVSLFGGFAPPAARQTAAVFFRLLAVAPMNEHHVTAAWFGSVSVERNALLIAAWQGSEMWVPSAIERWHSQQSDLPVLIHALRAVLFDRYHQIINPNLWLLICPPILVAGLFCLPNLFNIHQKHHLFTKTKQIFCIFPPFYLHIWKISRIFAEKNNNMTMNHERGIDNWTGWIFLRLYTGASIQQWGKAGIRLRVSPRQGSV